ncbi:MAG: ribonuclease Z [Clostridia bacterium]|nr:ribonuclease Z [Clostridia bacterium]
MIDLCTLGTGGTIPMPDRALSSLYVRVNGRALLIDCGEGTQVGVQRLGWGIQCIDGLLITHFHADHCSGLPGMLLALTKSLRTDPLHIYGPVGLTQVVTGLRVIAPQLSFPVVLHEIDGHSEPFRLIGLEITPFAVAHGIPCLGYRLHLPRPAAFDPQKARALGVPLHCWKLLQRGETVSADGRIFEPSQVLGAPRKGITVLYATDTRPVPAIPELGRGCDMMILEGMYGPEEKLPLALRNHHMLFREAAALAKEAEAAQLILTHYSTCISDPLEYLPLAQDVFPAASCAADGMTWTLKYPVTECPAQNAEC